ncbi:hypothetical protein [Actinomycetospora sp. CA-084318]|uniref:TY-Chap2 family putative peptide chaperone n=1 Tax=Actinomycetospora sp. CA-084318 TaxID=3239892 RepID=UPI003D959E5F
MFELAPRFVTAQSWWIASEIARRHPHLQLIETHPGGGLYDCLTLISPGPTNLLDLNREGSIHARTFKLTWVDALAAPGGHDLIKRLEADLDLSHNATTPATTARTLTYRVLARVLTSLVDDRHRWDARNGYYDSSGGDGGQRTELQQFPTVVDALEDRRPDDLLGIPAYRFWVLLRDDDPVAVLDTDGRLHQPDQPCVEFLPLYRRHQSRLTATIGAALGHLLP